jgi:hypothetical protein
MESQALSSTSPQTGDAESTMRRNLGLDGPSPSSANDPLKAARQAIRSQTAAREYAEQQTVQAQSTIQDLRGRLRHVHQERESAINAAQSAMAAKDAAERSVRAAESALANERAARARIEGMLRDAEATVRDLREKLAAAHQTLRGTQAELATDRQARSSEDDAVIVMPEAATPIRKTEIPVIRRPVGRPRKATMAEMDQTPAKPPEKPLAIRDGTIPLNVDAVGQAVRRPVGRPRKMVVVEPTSKVMTPPKKGQVSGKRAAKSVQKIKDRDADDQEPVQWWVEGWKER